MNLILLRILWFAIGALVGITCLAMVQVSDEEDYYDDEA